MEPPAGPGVARAQVEAAAARIRGDVRRTPAVTLDEDTRGIGRALTLKLESLQVTGSFKARNAFSLLRGAAVPAAGAVAASGGNFGFAVAHAARRLGHPLTVFVPRATPEVKLAAIRGEGAEIEVVPGPAAGAFAAAEWRAEQTGALLAHPYDLPEVVAGAGTCAVELEEQAPDLDTVLVAVGGGGLIGGIATWYGDRVRTVGVETHGTPTLHDARRAGEPVEIVASGIGASALGAPRLGALGWAAQRWVTQSLLVDDDEVRDAQRLLWSQARVVAEAGGAVALAALTSGAYVPEPGERIGVIVCGANTDPAEISAASS